MFPELTIRRELTTSDHRIQTEKIQKNSQKWFDDLGNEIAYGFYDSGYSYFYISDTALFQFSDEPKNVVVYTFEQTSQDLIYDIYYRNALPLILQANGKEVIHASAVMSRDQIAAFCANSGVGKSTLAYGMYKRGYELSADDAVVLEVTRSKVNAHPLPFRTRLLEESKAYFTKSEYGIGDNQLESNGSFQIREKSILKSIFILNKLESLGNEANRISVERLNPVEGFSLLLSQAYVFNLTKMKSKRRMMENYLEIANITPIYRIEFPHNFEYFSDLLDQIEIII